MPLHGERRRVVAPRDGGQGTGASNRGGRGAGAEAAGDRRPSRRRGFSPHAFVEFSPGKFSAIMPYVHRIGRTASRSLYLAIFKL